MVKSRTVPVAVLLGLVALVAGGVAAWPAPADRRELPIRGMVRPLNQAAIATELQARIADVRFREGQAFRKGDLLIAFDCERQEAELAAAAAQHREMTLALESAAYLDKRGAVGRYDVEVSRARVDKAAADVAALKARLKQCNIFAPYDGRVAELFSHAHEIPAPGKPLISLVDETMFEIELIVPSHWLRTISSGTSFKFAVDELGGVHDGTIVRIGAAVDPVSQTIKIIGEFIAKPKNVLSGMSGNATFGERN